MSELLCNDCLDTGWLEDKAGRSVCSCIAETEPYQQLQAEVERLRKAVEDWHDAAVRAERNAAMSQEETLSHINRIAALMDEAERLRQCCTQRGARMQIMRDWLDEPRGLHTPGLWPPTEWYYFTQDRPEAEKWFDEDGVPVDTTAPEGA